MRPRRFPRPEVKRAIVYLPNGFTLFNLFCGVHAIVLAARGHYSTASYFIVAGGVADALDGRVARATGSHSAIGEELDSLVDAISFGLAPAMITYFAVLNRDNWEWVFSFLFTACAVMRLARFNIEQAGRPKTHFHGLPSPAAGMTLATFFLFSQTRLYSDAIIFFTAGTTLADLPWHTIMRALMVLLSFLMISNVPYPALPAVGVRSVRQMFGTVIVVGGILGLIFIPRQFVFPALIGYILFGILKWVALGFLEIRARPEDVYLEEDPDFPSPAPASTPVVVSTRPDVSSSPMSRGTPATGMAALEGAASASRRKRRRRRPRSERPDRPDRPDRPNSGPNSNPTEGSNE